MFSNSEQLRKRIQAVSEEILLRSDGKISFEEAISLPHYGYIILRFNLNETNYTLSDVDRYEAMMYDCVGDEFLVDFMGEVYRNLGINYRDMENLFAACLDFCGNEQLSKSVYAEMIENDAKHLLARCNLPTNLPVWEIQIEEGIQLLILGDSNEPLGRYDVDGTVVNAYRLAATPCEGLIAAAFYAKRNNVSLANVLMRVQNSKQ